MDRTQIFIISFLVVVLSGALGFWFGRDVERRLEEVKPAQAEVADISGLQLVGANAILVNDQGPGMKVEMAMTTLAQESWIAIHEDRDGQPGNILGAQLFSAGQSQKGTVELLRQTQEGQVYYAMLHADDGDRKFDHTKDLPQEDSQGNVILMRFVATVSPEE